MADWDKKVVSFLLRLSKDDPELTKRILARIRQLEKNPSQGIYVKNTRRGFTDFKYRFRIGYNHHPNSKEIEIVTIVLF